MDKEHFIRNSLILLVTTTIASAIHYLFQFSMGRLLGPADYSILAALFSIIYIVQAPVQAVQLTLTKFIAEFKASNKLPAIGALLEKSLRKVAIMSAIVFFAFVIFSPAISEFLNIPSKNILIEFSFFFLATFLLADARGFLQGMQKFKALGLTLITESSAKLVLSVILVASGIGVSGAVWGTNIGTLIAFIIAVFILFKILRGYPAPHIAHDESLAIYKYSAPILLALSSVTMLYSVDVLLVKHFFPAAEAGYYAAAALVSKVIFFALMPISQAMFPKVAELNVQQKTADIVFLKAISIVAALSGVAVTIYFLAPKFVLNFLFGTAYDSAVPLISLFGLAISFLSISYVFINYFLSSGKTKFIYVLPVFVLAEIILIWFWHASLYVVILEITVLFFILLLCLAISYVQNIFNQKRSF